MSDELAPGVDAQLPIGPTQVRLDGLRAQEEGSSGFLVRRSFRYHERDLQLLGREFVACGGIVSPDGLAARAKLASGFLGPGPGSEMVEDREGPPEMRPRLNTVTGPTQTLSEAELEAPALERPRKALAVLEAFFEDLAEVLRRGE
jgi:hypothetical protein